jgi:soluble lytic murein transglycosylase-like protein
LAADPPRTPGSRQAIEASVARQQQAVAAMAQSIAAQRASIAKQAGEVPPGSFFLLAPPAPSGITLNRAPGSDCDPIPAAELDLLIHGAAKREDLPPELLRSVVRQESGFRPCALSPKGAMGLMQLMPDTAAQFGVKDPFNPKDNVDAGARLLKQLLTLYDDLPMALGAYNAGPAKVDEAGGVPKIPETMNYIQKILSLLQPPLAGKQ